MFILPFFIPYFIHIKIVLELQYQNSNVIQNANRVLNLRITFG